MVGYSCHNMLQLLDKMRRRRNEKERGKETTVNTSNPLPKILFLYTTFPGGLSRSNASLKSTVSYCIDVVCLYSGGSSTYPLTLLVVACTCTSVHPFIPSRSLCRTVVVYL